MPTSPAALPSMEDSMCWEMGYQFFAEQEKAKKAETTKEQRAGVIKNLLKDANRQAEKTSAEATPVNEVVPPK
jgi:hypothetical protein